MKISRHLQSKQNSEFPKSDRDAYKSVSEM